MLLKCIKVKQKELEVLLKILLKKNLKLFYKKNLTFLLICAPNKKDVKASEKLVIVPLLVLTVLVGVAPGWLIGLIHTTMTGLGI